MEITYDYYRIFYYAAKYKSFSKAAEILMSNQPNITHFMNNLENQLGCRLFIRSRHGVTLTPFQSWSNSHKRRREALQTCNNRIPAFSDGRAGACE